MGGGIRWRSASDPGPSKRFFWRLLGRMAPLVILLFLLWAYVLPYQAAVQIDKSLAVWARAHAGWRLERLGGGAYERSYHITWTAPEDRAPSIRAGLTVRIRPVGWSSDQGQRQWGWATFSLSMAPDSPIQMFRWPDDPWRLNGLVGWLGTWEMALPRSGPESGSAHLTYDPRSGRWQGALNLPAWTVKTPSSTWRFGRSSIDFDLNISPATGDSTPFAGILGEVGVDVRRLGWVGPTERGLVDDLQARLRQSAHHTGKLRDLIGSVSIGAARSVATTLGASQVTFGIFDAEPDVLQRLVDLGLRIPTLAVTPPAVATPDALWSALEHDRAQPALMDLLNALRRAEVHLDALRYQSPQGSVAVRGVAYGPRFSMSASSPQRASEAPCWQAQFAIEMDDAWLAQWPSDEALRWSARLQHRQNRWVGDFAYGAKGWQVSSRPVDISTIPPQD